VKEKEREQEVLSPFLFLIGDEMKMTRRIVYGHMDSDSTCWAAFRPESRCFDKGCYASRLWDRHYLRAIMQNYDKSRSWSKGWVASV
jgi:hypothetical protein